MKEIVLFSAKVYYRIFSCIKSLKLRHNFVIYAYAVYNTQPVSKLKGYVFFVSWGID